MNWAPSSKLGQSFHVLTEPNVDFKVGLGRKRGRKDYQRHRVSLLNEKLWSDNVKVSPGEGRGDAIIGAVFKKSVCSRNEGGAAGLACWTGSDTAVATRGLCATFKVQSIVTSKADYGKMWVSFVVTLKLRAQFSGAISPPHTLKNVLDELLSSCCIISHLHF